MLSTCAIYLSLLVLVEVSGKNIGRVKRELNWVEGNIQSRTSSSSRILVKYLRPNPNNAKVKDNKDYMAFSLYKIGEDTGEFYFIESNIANDNRHKCKNPTMHAGAFYYFFKRCPTDEKELIASGYCYQGTNGRGLVFNSDTFNSGYSKLAYLDSEYYKSDDRSVNPYEQNLIVDCFTRWKESGFQVISWTCEITGTTRRRRRNTVSTCSNCTCA